MSRPERLNQRQYAFLRKVRNHPHGLPTLDWPRSADLRRWMKRPGFVAALTSLQASFRAEADLLLAGASARAAMNLQDILSCDGGGCTPAFLQAHSAALMTLGRLVRFDHMRQKEQSSLQLVEDEEPKVLSAFEVEALAQARWERDHAASVEADRVARAARAESLQYASGGGDLRVHRAFEPEPFGERGQNEPKSALENSGNSPIMTDNSMEAGL